MWRTAPCALALARAGGGPSSFYLGGGDPYRGGGGGGVVEHLDGAFTRFSEGNGAFVDARAFDAAEERRRQLVADLDAQVRAKREQKRLRELREALEDAKIERRIQEVVEQERLEREMKERLLDRSGDAPGEYRVANSPRASVAIVARAAPRARKKTTVRETKQHRYLTRTSPISTGPRLPWPP